MVLEAAQLRAMPHRTETCGLYLWCCALKSDVQRLHSTAAMACAAPEATCVLIGIQDALHAAYSGSGALMSALRRRLWAACPGPRHRLVRRHRRSASSEEFITHGHLVPAWNLICQTMQLQQRPAAMACPEPEEVCALKRIPGRHARCMPLRLRFDVHLETSAWRRWP